MGDELVRLSNTPGGLRVTPEPAPIESIANLIPVRTTARERARKLPREPLVVRP